MAEAEDEKAKRGGHAQGDDDRRRADGEAFDQRMKDFAADAPRPARSDPDRRRRR